MTAALFDPAFEPAPPRLALVPPSPPARPGLGPEVYRRRRLGVLAVVVGLALGVASFGRQATATPVEPGRVADGVVVVVQPGDTLWEIATGLAPGTDPRPLVAALGEFVDPTELQPGQQIVIPADLLG